MKYIFKYEKFIIESNNDKLNEEIIGWIKKKASEWLDNMRDINTMSNKSTSVKDDELEKLIQILPDDVIEVIKKEASLLSNKNNESLFINLILEAMFDGILGNLPDDEEINKMSDEQYDEYLKTLSDDKYFKFYPDDDNNWLKGTSEFGEFQKYLLSRGIEVNRDIVVDCKPSISNIQSKIDSLDISDSSKKVLKVAAITVFFMLISSKAYSTAGHTDTHSMKPEKGDASHASGKYTHVDDTKNVKVSKSDDKPGSKKIDTFDNKDMSKAHATMLGYLISDDIKIDKTNIEMTGAKVELTKYCQDIRDGVKQPNFKSLSANAKTLYKQAASDMNKLDSEITKKYTDSGSTVKINKDTNS
jgi:hypothetical protein